MQLLVPPKIYISVRKINVDMKKDRKRTARCAIGKLIMVVDPNEEECCSLHNGPSKDLLDIRNSFIVLLKERVNGKRKKFICIHEGVDDTAMMDS